MFDFPRRREAARCAPGGATRLRAIASIAMPGGFGKFAAGAERAEARMRLRLTLSMKA